MVDATIRAAKTAAILDAVGRIRESLPETAEQLRDDRTAREIVILNLFVAIQEAIDLATHWVSDEGWTVPSSYGEVFLVLVDHGIIERDLAKRLVKAAGLRNLIAHRYGSIDSDLLHSSVPGDLDDLTALCRVLAQQNQ